MTVASGYCGLADASFMTLPARLRITATDGPMPQRSPKRRRVGALAAPGRPHADREAVAGLPQRALPDDDRLGRERELRDDLHLEPALDRERVLVDDGLDEVGRLDVGAALRVTGHPDPRHAVALQDPGAQEVDGRRERTGDLLDRPGDGQHPRDALGGQRAHDVVDLGLAADRPGREVGHRHETGLVDPAGAGHRALEAGVGEPGDEDGGPGSEDAVEGWQLVELAWRDLDAEVGHELAHPLLERTPRPAASSRLAGRLRVDAHRSPLDPMAGSRAPAPRSSSTSSASRNSSAGDRPICLARAPVASGPRRSRRRAAVGG